MTDGINQKNAGFVSYPDRVQKKTYFRATDRYTKSVTVKSGQVLKAHSFVETDASGKSVGLNNIAESANVSFSAAVTAGQTVILAGLTFTAGASGATAKQLAAAWSGIADGTAFGTLTVTAGGTFTAGTLTGYYTESLDDDTAIFNASSAFTNATNVAITGTGAGSGSVVVDATVTSAPVNGIAVLAFDVDASAGDVKASAFTQASFWTDALVWAIDPAVDVLTLANGTTVACTTYNTGCYGDSEASNLMKQKLVDGTGFKELGFLSEGEKA